MSSQLTATDAERDAAFCNLLRFQRYAAILNERSEAIDARASAPKTPKMVHCSARTVIFCYNCWLIGGHADQPKILCLTNDLWFVFAIFLSIGLLT